MAFLLVLFVSQAFAQKPLLKSGLKKFVKANTIYPLYALQNCIEGAVEVSFKLNKAGEVTYTTISKSIGADLDAEALRLIKLTSGKWQVPVGFDTTSLIKSNLKFSLVDYGCERMNPASMGLAIKNYADRLEKINKITRFFSNAETSVLNSTTLEEIEAIKVDLGIDEEYVNKRLAVAERKIKQGDLQGACEDFMFVKYMGYSSANEFITKYCK